MTPEQAYNILGNDHNHKDRESLEHTICSDAKCSYKYAINVINGRWKLGEAAISESAERSYWYAKYIIEGRFVLGEAAISKDAELSYEYAINVIKGRWELGEAVISKEAEWSFWYAKYVIRGNWTTELAVMCPCWLFFYAKDVSKGRLPKAMHNKMLVFGMIDSSDKYVKKYLEKKLKNDSRNSV